MKKIVKVIQILLIISISSTVLFAQAKTSGSMKSKVVDEFSNDPLPIC